MTFSIFFRPQTKCTIRFYGRKYTIKNGSESSKINSISLKKVYIQFLAFESRKSEFYSERTQVGLKRIMTLDSTGKKYMKNDYKEFFSCSRAMALQF